MHRQQRIREALEVLKAIEVEVIEDTTMIFDDGIKRSQKRINKVTHERVAQAVRIFCTLWQADAVADASANLALLAESEIEEELAIEVPEYKSQSKE